MNCQKCKKKTGLLVRIMEIKGNLQTYTWICEKCHKEMNQK